MGNSRMKFSANLGFLFAELDLVARINGAAACGFEAVELHWPYAVPAVEINAALRTNGLRLIVLNTLPGNSALGEFGLAAVPGRAVEFRETVQQALDYAVATGAAAVHCMAGLVGAQGLAAAEHCFVENLQVASDLAAAAGVGLLIEPINTRDKPGFALTSVEQAAAIIRRTGRRNIKIMFDCYHVQIMQGDLTRRIEQQIELIGHVQIAAVPSRAEPDAGEVNYLHIMATLQRLGYAGWVGAEYKPGGRTEDGLSWRVAFTTRI